MITFISETMVDVTLGKTPSPALHEKIMLTGSYLSAGRFPLIKEWFPTYTGLTLVVDPEMDLNGLEKAVREAEAADRMDAEGARWEIPVCYEAPFSEDRERIESYLGMSWEEMTERHTDREYLVYMIGFLPGFPYLGGMDPSIAVPRLDKPRARVEKGAVGIAGEQTGVYPAASPGGWNIIGRTPVPLYTPGERPEVLFAPGDRIRFVRVKKTVFDEEAVPVWEEESDGVRRFKW
ncbi:5-oxoprolinase subunit PxpB [Alkalicoccus urumqiensis]|uniref:Carboxyltransferase domain-containing protein n=1 Tax=Alkalicoccus urumqiensis TaxID=1548213 RepID=A0A2P6ML86_ALKUR|nr:5-oxoprolinase subunit PxpB [Alkalicoccus urumqiensis]PRO67025.1 hypothetical protein C6I21_00205 [Alkalicoccus urumqiensis]